MKLPGVADRVNFYVLCMSSPTINKLCKEIDNEQLSSFPGNLTSKQVRKNSTKTTEMLKGHQDQIQQGLISTKTTKNNIKH